ncbi:YrzE family protein [Crystallibacter degradans]|uniref:YrzE family protein n=1 Tax=Crystallibacter degradans TaxID=2726743 RepID=UPI001476354B|nr:YrzE family protein [Arthrobacter sp. SF27]NMR30714.1 YrzE family protein [Arthrobacter sp. SF27]
MSEDKVREKNDDGTRRGSENPLWQEQVAESGRPPVDEGDTAAHTTVLNTAGEGDRTAAGSGGTETRPLDRSAAPAASTSSTGTSGSNDTTVLGTPDSSGSNDTTVLNTSGVAAAAPAGRRISAERAYTGDQASTDEQSGGEYQPRDTDAYRPVTPLDREAVFVRQRDAFGGVKLGSAFFGWLSATGMIVLLLSIATGITVAFGFSALNDLQNPEAIASGGGAAAIPAAIVLGVILLLSYFAGGYVAGRMARFDGVRQGLAVWLWGIVMAVVASVVGLATGGMDVINSFTGNSAVSAAIQDLTVPGLIALAIVLVLTLGGALLGGLAGMRFHRKVDRAGFGPDNEY